VLLLIAACGPQLCGQVFEVNGGASSLYQTQGGTVSVHGPSYDASIGAGILAGRFIGGANVTKVAGRATYILGDDYIRFELPTDVFDTSHYLVAQGAGVKSTLRNIEMFAFAGATTTQFSSPLFEGARAQDAAGILFLKKQLGPTLEMSTKTIVSRRTTAIESLQWEPAEKLSVAVSGGIGADQPYGAGSFSLSRRRFDVKAAYIDAGRNFHRAAVETPLLSEPNRENVVMTIRPAKVVSFSAGRQNFLSPIGYSQNNVRSSVDQLSGDVEVAGVGVTASVYHSAYLGSSNNATAFMADKSLFSHVHTAATYLQSRPSNGVSAHAFIATFSEILSPRWNVIEEISRSKGQTTASFGGGFLSNVASISAEYQTFYVPERNSAPFEQALIIDAKLHLFHGVTLHGATFVAPDGSLRYTIDVQGVIARMGTVDPANAAGAIERATIGNMMLRGRALDTEGHPVPGAALMVDALLVYTDDDGWFYLRERKSRTHQFKVLGDRFLNGGVYRVISAPTTTKSSALHDEPETLVVVQRVVPSRPGDP
jgi:hypothetical protein